MKKSLLLIAAFSFVSNITFAEEKTKEEPAAISQHTITLNHYKDGSAQIVSADHQHIAPEKGHPSEKQAILFSDKLVNSSKNAVKKVSTNARPAERGLKPTLTQIVSETPSQHIKDPIQAHAQNAHTNVAPAAHAEAVVQPVSAE